MSDQKTEKSYTIFDNIIFVFVFLTVLAGFIVIYQINQFFPAASKSNPLDVNATDAVGSFVGGVVGPLWAFAGMLLFFVAIRIQSKQLKTQQNELSLQRQELAATREVFEIQKFETTFFNLLTMRKQLSQDISIYINGQNYLGKEAFSETVKELRVLKSDLEAIQDNRNCKRLHRENLAFMNDFKYKNIDKNDEDDIKIDSTVPNVVDKVSRFKTYLDIHNKECDKVRLSTSIFLYYYKAGANNLINYINNLTYIVEFIYYAETNRLKEDVSKEQSIKNRYQSYFNLFRLQLSADELEVIFYFSPFYIDKSVIKLLKNYDIYFTTPELKKIFDEFLDTYPILKD